MSSVTLSKAPVVFTFSSFGRHHHVERLFSYIGRCRPSQLSLCLSRRITSVLLVTWVLRRSSYLFVFSGAITLSVFSVTLIFAPVIVTSNRISSFSLNCAGFRVNYSGLVGRQCTVRPNGRLCCGRRRAPSEQSNLNGNQSIIILKLPVFGARQHQALSWASDAAS